MAFRTMLYGMLYTNTTLMKQDTPVVHYTYETRSCCVVSKLHDLNAKRLFAYILYLFSLSAGIS